LIHQTTSNIKKIFPKRVSYQASPTYSLGEFPGVITNWRRCRGEEIRSSASLGDDIDPALMIDKAWTSFGCNHLSGDSMKDDSMKDEFSGDSIVQKIVGDSTGMT
jgi:hypothetical protein